ncbi:hypothetical protein HTG_01660 [Natrinema mahii]|nr:hypothetical protein HTG_01660 [Natrinema mahii]
MIGGSVDAMIEAGLVIGIVLLEAIVLYVGYGAAEQVLAGPVVDRIKNV